MAQALYPGIAAAQDIGQNGVEFAGLRAYDGVSGYNSLREYFERAHNRQEVTSHGQGTFVGYNVRDDMQGITTHLGVIYLGMLKGKLHWLNKEKGLPAILTKSIYFTTGVVRWENFVPVQTPAMGVPPLARRMTQEIVSKAENYTLSFQMEGEHFGEDVGNIELSSNIAQIAGSMAHFMAREAYRALHFPQALRVVRRPMGNTEEDLIMYILAERDAHAMVHKHENGVQMLAELCSTRIRTGPSQLNATIGVFPMGKMSAIMTRNALYTHYDKAGEDGPKRLRNGIVTDEESGNVIETGVGLMLSNGVEIREGPAVQDNDSRVMEMNREVYTGDNFHIDHERDADYGIGRNGLPNLPWIRVFSATHDDWMPIHFEDAFRNCGRFRLVTGAAGPGKTHSDDPETYLWTLDMTPYADMDAANLPRATANGNADPFVYKLPAGDVVVRPWCSLPARPNYYDDLPKFYPPPARKLSIRELDTLRQYIYGLAERRRVLIAGLGAAPAAGAADLINASLPDDPDAEGDKPARWEQEMWELYKAREDTRNITRWNNNIATADAAGDFVADRIGARAAAEAAGGARDAFRARFQRRVVVPANSRTMREWAELVQFSLMRPSVGTRMQDVPFYVAGSVGYTFHGNLSYSMSHNVGNNSWLVRADFRLGVHMHDEHAVCVGRNAVYHGILSGSDARVMTFAQAQALAQNNFVMDHNHSSIYSICIPRNHVYWQDAGMTVTFDPNRTVSAVSGTFPIASTAVSQPHYPGYVFYNEHYGFGRLALNGMSGLDAPISPVLLRGGRQIPTKAGFREEVSKAHHGPEAPGVRETRMTGRRLNPVLI